jgi:hypothetical protein
VTALLNVDDDPYRFPVDATGLHLADAGVGTTTAHGGDPLTVPAHGWAILTS